MIFTLPLSNGMSESDGVTVLARRYSKRRSPWVSSQPPMMRRAAFFPRVWFWSIITRWPELLFT